MRADAAEKRPHWPLVCQRLLHGDESVPLVLMIFDLLREDGEDLTRRPCAERRERLEALGLESTCWRTPDVFDDGHALYQAVCGHGLEGIVAKRLTGIYRPGRRGWVKIENPDYWRRESEVEVVQRSIQRRTRAAARAT